MSTRRSTHRARRHGTHHARRHGTHHARRRGYHLSARARANMSAARKGKRHPHKGHRLSAATKKKISAKLKGRRHHTRRTAHKTARHTAVKRHTTHRLKRHAAPRTFIPRIRRTTVKSGAKRGFFRHTTLVHPRTHRFMRVTNRVRPSGFLRNG